MRIEPTVELILKPGEEGRLLRGHLWVFSNELRAVPDAEPGTLALARSAQGKVLGIGFFNPKSLISFRLLSRSPDPVTKEFFRRRLDAALALRKRLYGAERSFRMCFGESDGLPGLVADKYEDRLVLQILAAGMERMLPLVQEALMELVSPKGIFLSNDHPARRLEGLPAESRVLWGEVPDRVRFEEEGISYVASIAAGQKTGFYFDQRENRLALAPFFKGRVVLDLFCYCGGFSLRAARSGAKAVLGLDSSDAAVELARENAGLNGLGEVCRFEQGDAEHGLGEVPSLPEDSRPSLILLDPPSFVPSRRHLPKALRAYAKLNAQALKVLPRGGILATSTCSHHVSREDFLKMLREAAAKAGRSVRLMELRGQAKDHPVLLGMPETEYLHFAILEAAS